MDNLNHPSKDERIRPNIKAIIFYTLGVRKSLILAFLSLIFTNMFIGEYTYSLDTKRRLGIPAKIRKSLGKKAVITRGLDKCLFLFSTSEWDKLAERLSQLPMSKADARGLARIMLAGATDVIIDSLGRILIPDYLKKYAGLKKKAIITGISNRVEIWDEMLWEDYKTKAEKDMGDMAERLTEIGF